VRESRLNRLSGWAGVAFFSWLVVAAVVYAGIIPMPATGDDAAYVRMYFTDHGDAVLFHAWMSGLLWGIAFLVFAFGLRERVATPAGSARPPWGRVATAGAVLATAFGGVGLVFETVAALMARTASDELLVVMALVVTIADATLLYWGLAVFVGAASRAVRETDFRAAWLGGLGFVSAGLMIIGAAWPLTGDDRGVIAVLGLIGLTLVAIWVLLVSLRMLRTDTAPRGAG